MCTVKDDDELTSTYMYMCTWALQLGSKGRYGLSVGGRQNYVIPCYIWAISEHFRDKGLIYRCYINSSVYFTFYYVVLATDHLSSSAICCQLSLSPPVSEADNSFSRSLFQELLGSLSSSVA